jgi:hypothetical protein
MIGQWPACNPGTGQAPGQFIVAPDLVSVSQPVLAWLPAGRQVVGVWGQ